jgi:phosphatidylglycerophosphatase A
MTEPVRFDPRRPHHWLAYGFGSGLLPVAPGSWGTLAAIPLYLLLAPLPLAVYMGVTLLAFAVGVWACGRTGEELGVHDHPAIVWDEVVGLLITLTAAPSGWPWLLGGVALFRLFDIWKPWPIGPVDRRVKGGVGVMLDDVLAGLMALAVLQGVNTFL